MPVPLIDINPLAGTETAEGITNKIKLFAAEHRRFRLKWNTLLVVSARSRKWTQLYSADQGFDVEIVWQGANLKLPYGWRYQQMPKDASLWTIWQPKPKDKELVTRVGHPHDTILYAESYLYGEEIAKPGNTAKIMVELKIWKHQNKRLSSVRAELKDGELFHWGNGKPLITGNADLFIPVLLNGLKSS